MMISPNTHNIQSTKKNTTLQFYYEYIFTIALAILMRFVHMVITSNVINIFSIIFEPKEGEYVNKSTDKAINLYSFFNMNRILACQSAGSSFNTQKISKINHLCYNEQWKIYSSRSLFFLFVFVFASIIRFPLVGTEYLIDQKLTTTCIFMWILYCLIIHTLFGYVEFMGHFFVNNGKIKEDIIIQVIYLIPIATTRIVISLCGPFYIKFGEIFIFSLELILGVCSGLISLIACSYYFSVKTTIPVKDIFIPIRSIKNLLEGLPTLSDLFDYISLISLGLLTFHGDFFQKMYIQSYNSIIQSHVQHTSAITFSTSIIALSDSITTILPGSAILIFIPYIKSRYAIGQKFKKGRSNIVKDVIQFYFTFVIPFVLIACFISFFFSASILKIFNPEHHIINNNTLLINKLSLIKSLSILFNILYIGANIIAKIHRMYMSAFIQLTIHLILKFIIILCFVISINEPHIQWVVFNLIVEIVSCVAASVFLLYFYFKKT